MTALLAVLAYVAPLFGLLVCLVGKRFRAKHRVFAGAPAVSTVAIVASSVLALGCGSGSSAAMLSASVVNGNGGTAATPSNQVLALSASALSFNYVSINKAAMQTVILSSKGTQPVTISSVSATGSGFSVSGASFPLTLKPYQTASLTVQFAPTAIGSTTGQVNILASSGAMAIPLSAVGGAPPLSSFYCATGTPAVSTKTVVCTLKTSAASASGSVSVNLASSDSAVTVPATVSLPANSLSVQFTANLRSVLNGETVTLSASSAGTTMNTALKLTGTSQALTLSTGSLDYQYVPLGSSSPLTLMLVSTGEQPVTITAVKATGSGFSIDSLSLPLTLKPKQTATLTARFAPTSSGGTNGQLLVLSDATTGGPTVASLSGTGGNAPLKALYCATATVTGAATDTCTVKVSTASTGSAQTITLSKDSALLAMPLSVSVAAGSTTAQFPVVIANGSAASTARLSASSGGVSQTFAITLTPTLSVLNLSRNLIAFTNVPINTTANQSITLTSAGTAPVTVSGVAVNDSAFTISGVSPGLTLPPGGSATLIVQYRPSSAATRSGLLTVSSNSSVSSGPVTLSGTAINTKASTQSAQFPYSGGTMAITVSRAKPSVITPSFFGMTIYNLAPNSTYVQPNMTPFPSFPVSTMRFWDSSYWAMIDSYKGQNNWTKLDNQLSIAAAHGVQDFIFTFGHPPLWASTQPGAPCLGGEGPGTCAPPDLAAYDDFTTKVVQRYCGKIQHYEPWNEPDNSQFWIGTKQQMLTMAQHTYQIVKDPANCGCTNGICKPGGGANPNKVLLPGISTAGPDSRAWLDGYLSLAGNNAYADISSFHNYGFTSDPEGMVSHVQGLRSVLAAHGLSQLELWDTEASWESNTRLSAAAQAGWLIRFHAIQAALGVDRFLWYAYENCSWGTLYSSPLCPVSDIPYTQMTQAGQAYVTAEKWLTGSTIGQCQVYDNGLWTCQITEQSGKNAWMIWTAQNKTLDVPVPAELLLTQSRDWQDTVSALGSTVTASSMPLLLEP